MPLGSDRAMPAALSLVARSDHRSSPRRRLWRSATIPHALAHYEHTCRRCKARARPRIQGAPREWSWKFADTEQRTCPTCRMKLWITAVPRPIGFKDLRHSHATILRKQRVDLGTVQKELGHSSSEITARVYDQSALEDDRQAIERALTFAPLASPPEPPKPARHGEPVVRLAAVGKGEGPATSGFPRGGGAFSWSGRLDLNQRPLAPQASALPGCATPRHGPAGAAS